MTTALVLLAFGVHRRLHRAYLALDQEAHARYARLGLLLTGDDQWVTMADAGAWRALAETDDAAAQPLLERAAHRVGRFQGYYLLLLEASYGHLDVPALIEQRWSTYPRRQRPLLLHLAIGELVDRGRTTEALTRLGRATPAEVTRTARPLILAKIAAAIGDRDTLEEILAQGHPLLDAGVAELHRATAEQARGEAEAGDHRLRSLDVPAAGRIAHLAATRLAHPTPVLDESQLDDAARGGLALYRGLSRQAVSKS